MIKLVGVGLLDLLPRLYGEVRIPEAVLEEFRAKAQPGDPDLLTFPWLLVVPILADPSLMAMSSLGRGEIAVITLAQASTSRLVIMDDRQGRQVAQKRGLALTDRKSVV